MNKCKDYGTENCSTQELHQVQQMGIMRRNGIEPSKGFLEKAENVSEKPQQLELPLKFI